MNWIKMDTTKPTLGRRVILTDGKYVWMGLVAIEGVDYTQHAVFSYRSDNSSKIINAKKVTHWMSIPELPMKPGDQYEIPFTEELDDIHLINEQA